MFTMDTAYSNHEEKWYALAKHVVNDYSQADYVNRKYLIQVFTHIIDEDN